MESANLNNSNNNINNISNMDIEKSFGKYLPLILGLFIVVYTYFLKMPKFIKHLFNNSIFRIIFLSFLFIYRYDKTPGIAITLALFFILIIYFINKEDLNENIKYVKAYKQIQKEKRKVYLKK